MAYNGVMKFKNTKPKKVYKKAKPQKAKQLPNNSRFITEGIDRDEVIYFTGIFCILAAILVVSVDLYRNFNEQKRLTNEKIKVLSDLSFWEYQKEERPDYRDAYFNTAILAYRLKDFGKAKENLNQALIIDPNFEEGIEFRKFLED